MFCNKLRTLQSSLHIHLTQFSELLSKHLEADFKHLLGMELATDAIFFVLSSANSDLFTYVFATSVSCEIIYIDTTELKNFPYISARVTFPTSLSVKETCMLRLKIWMLSFLEGSKYPT